ncbi:hypothetical protein GGI42DRAFT_318979 [Trichoderma sp. SZMC 28013]
MDMWGNNQWAQLLAGVALWGSFFIRAGAKSKARSTTSYEYQVGLLEASNTVNLVPSLIYTESVLLQFSREA